MLILWSHQVNGMSSESQKVKFIIIISGGGGVTRSAASIKEGSCQLKTRGPGCASTHSHRISRWLPNEMDRDYRVVRFHQSIDRVFITHDRALRLIGQLIQLLGRNFIGRLNAASGKSGTGSS